MNEAADLMDALRRGVSLNEETARRYAQAADELSAKGWPVQAALMEDAAANSEATAETFRCELSVLEARFGPAESVP